MKLNKKIISLAAVAALSVTAVSSAFAAPVTLPSGAEVDVPVPADSDQAFVYAESFEWDGLYYEALGELQFVTNPDFYYQAKKAALENDLLYKIERWEVKCALDEIEKQWQFGDVSATGAAIAYAKTLNYNMTEFYTIQYWEKVLNDYFEKMSGLPITTEAGAINAVKRDGYRLESKNEWFSAKKLNANTYAVDIVTNVYGSAQTIAQFMVNTKTGGVTKTFEWGQN